MEFTWKEILVTALGSGGLLGGIITFFVFITGRLDARRKRIEDKKAIDISESVELKKLQVQSIQTDTGILITNLWAIINDQKAEIKCLTDELANCEDGDRLSIANVNRIFEYIRQIKNEMDSLNLMLLNDEETNIFAKRWGNIKSIMIDLEKLLNGGK